MKHHRHKHKWNQTKVLYTDPLQYEYQCACGDKKWEEDAVKIPTIKFDTIEEMELYIKEKYDKISK